MTIVVIQIIPNISLVGEFSSCTPHCHHTVGSQLAPSRKKCLIHEKVKENSLCSLPPEKSLQI